MKRILFSIIFMALCISASCKVLVSGRITDASSGEGISGVPVTDGYTYVKTDASGKYRINADPRATNIYYTTPSSYKINLDGQRHIPEFYSCRIDSLKGKQKIDFQLTPLEGGAERDFTLLMIGDPQCRSNKNASRYENETIADLQTTASGCTGSVYAITLGDVTFDSSNMWDRMASTMSNVSISEGYLPFFQCMGNHDHDSLVEDTDDDADDDLRARLRYVSTFGPVDYSFDRGDAHIVVMDNIIVHSKKKSTKPNKLTWSYTIGLTDSQLEWLRQDLSCVEKPQEKLLIFCVHCPFNSYLSKKGNNLKAALDMMTSFKECHIMAGHTHTQYTHIYYSSVTKSGYPVFEHVHGTACGSWWLNNTNLGGTPCGYNVYSVSGANVSSWRFKGTGCAADYQMRVYDGSQVYSGDKNLEYRWYEPRNVDRDSAVTCGFVEAEGSLVAEVFDDDKYGNWEVEMWIDGAKAGNFTRKGGKISNVALAAFYHNVQGRSGKHTRGNNTSHFWYFHLPEGITAADLESGRHTWEVRALFTVPTNRSNVLTYTCSRITRDYSEF